MGEYGVLHGPVQPRDSVNYVWQGPFILQEDSVAIVEDFDFYPKQVQELSSGFLWRNIYFELIILGQEESAPLPRR